jgi:hypothetical protein
MMKKWEDTMKKNILYLLICSASYGCASEDGALDRAGAAGGGGADVLERPLSKEYLDFYSNNFPQNPKGLDSYARLYNMMLYNQYSLLSEKPLQSYLADFEIAFGEVEDPFPEPFECFCANILNFFHEQGVKVSEKPQTKKVHDFLVPIYSEKRKELIISHVLRSGFTFKSDEIKDRLEEMKEYLKTPRMSGFIRVLQKVTPLGYVDFSSQDVAGDCVRELSARFEKTK